MKKPNPLKRTGRLAGILYLLLAVASIYGLVYVPSKIIVPQNVRATMQNIIAAPTVLRLGIVSNVIYLVIFIFLVLTFYDLFKEVNKKRAVIMVALVLVGIPVALVNELNHVAVLILLGDGEFVKTFTTDQIQFSIRMFLGIYEYGSYTVMIFWGLWLLPLGLLVLESEFLPRAIGILLIVGCFGYVVSSFTFLLSPQNGRTVFPIATLPSAISEVAIILWLLIKGARGQNYAVHGS